MTRKLVQQIKEIQRNTTPQQVNKLNSMILGMHNYYNIATLCSSDFYEINYIVRKSLYNRLKGHTKRGHPQIKQKAYQKFYGKYNGRVTIVAEIAIFPIYGCTYKKALKFTQDVNKFTVKGRELIHNKLCQTARIVQYLLENKEYDKSVEYNDNRISLIAGQQGKCAVTNNNLIIGDMECHHKIPRTLGGTDEYENLVWLKNDVHKLIHATQPVTIENYLKILNLDERGLKKVNSLRLLAENLEI